MWAARLRWVGVITAMVLAVGMFTAPSAGASVWDDNTDPTQTRCINDARTIASYAMTPEWYNGPVVTYLEVRYSPTCGTNWVRVYNPYAPGTHETYMSIRRDNGMGRLAFRMYTSGYNWTYQLYAPGSTCILVSAALTNVSTHQIDAGSLNQEVRVC